LWGRADKSRSVFFKATQSFSMQGDGKEPKWSQETSLDTKGIMQSITGGEGRLGRGVGRKCMDPIDTKEVEATRIGIRCDMGLNRIRDDVWGFGLRH
jgi:hypothetical protein